MRLMGSPVSSKLSAINRFIKRVWDRTRAKIHSRVNHPSDPLPIQTSPVAKIPQEIVGVIISYLANDVSSLRACTLTCRSWHIAAARHLHCALFVGIGPWNRKHRWPNPIRFMDTFGLLPFVQTFRISNSSSKKAFSPKLFNSRILRQFSALANVKRLDIHGLDISRFIPKFRQYFGHFFPTVRYLTLRAPKGSHQQIIYFVGSFEHLTDFSIHGTKLDEEPNVDQTLTPPFSPPLDGRLLVWHIRGVGFFREMARLLGGIRFTSMDIFDADDIRFLLSACPKTLRKVRLYPTDPRASSYLADFDLSRNQSLRVLETTVASVDSALKAGSLEIASELLKRVLSTIKSPVFHWVVVIYQDHDFRGINTSARSEWPHLHEMSQAEKTEEDSQHQKRFELLRELHKVWDFRLVLRADTWDPVGEYTVRVLKEAVVAEKANRGSHGFFHHPSVTHHSHRSLRSVAVPR